VVIALARGSQAALMGKEIQRDQREVGKVSDIPIA